MHATFVKTKHKMNNKKRDNNNSLTGVKKGADLEKKRLKPLLIWLLVTVGPPRLGQSLVTSLFAQSTTTHSDKDVY